MTTNYDMEPPEPTSPVWWAIAAIITLAAAVSLIPHCQHNP